MLTLDQRDQLDRGLELTAVSVAAIAKYPWVRDFKQKDRATKFNFYASEADALALCRSWFPGGETSQTVEASIMDIADDITYAVHDLEDFLASGIVDPGAVADDLRLLLDLTDDGIDSAEQVEPGSRPEQYLLSARRARTYYSDFFDADEHRKAIESAAQFFELLALQQGDIATNGLLRDQMSNVIGQYIDAIVCSSEPAWTNGPYIYLQPYEWHHIQVLKTVAKAHIVDRDDRASPTGSRGIRYKPAARG